MMRSVNPMDLVLLRLVNPDKKLEEKFEKILTRLEALIYRMEGLVDGAAQKTD